MSYNYNKVSPEIVQKLKAIFGGRFVTQDEEKMENYSHDETDKKVWGHNPEVVVIPANPEEIAKVVKLANEEKIPITPRGAGSGLSGGAIPHLGGILLSVERLNKLIELDKANMVGVVEAGMVTNEFAMLVQNEGLFYAGYPMSLQTCMIGGNIAENAGGGKAVKYGVTGRYIQGLELVTPTGDIVWLGGKISGEHGIGIKRRDALAKLIDPVELKLMKAIKKAWDPNNIMNPGKVFE